jgi:hypothetical protein
MQIIVILFMLAKWQAAPVRETLVIQGLAINLSRKMAGKCLKLGHNRFFLSDSLYTYPIIFSCILCNQKCR